MEMTIRNAWQDNFCTRQGPSPSSYINSSLLQDQLYWYNLYSNPLCIVNGPTQKTSLIHDGPKAINRLRTLSTLPNLTEPNLSSSEASAVSSKAQLG